jgi:hypothetical protein
MSTHHVVIPNSEEHRMFKNNLLNSRSFLMVVVMGFAAITASVGISEAQEQNRTIEGGIVAVGIPGASAISPVGTFLPGGPIHDNPDFADYAQPGKILDPTRILVGSTSNLELHKRTCTSGKVRSYQLTRPAWTRWRSRHDSPLLEDKLPLWMVSCRCTAHKALIFLMA